MKEISFKFIPYGLDINNIQFWPVIVDNIYLFGVVWVCLNLLRVVIEE